ncbi:hypothetical protein H0X09_04010 [Candidatus Saccharibacteria bacterium]|nr:hypothetical protein [Candidatus Saccharibacteria bacterium]
MNYVEKLRRNAPLVGFVFGFLLSRIIAPTDEWLGTILHGLIGSLIFIAIEKVWTMLEQ